MITNQNSSQPTPLNKGNAQNQVNQPNKKSKRKKKYTPHGLNVSIISIIALVPKDTGKTTNEKAIKIDYRNNTEPEPSH